MIRPSFDEAKQYLKGATIIPIALEILADIKTSVEVLRTIRDENEKCYMLESVQKGENWGRYSFIGFAPKMTIQCADKKIIENDGTKKEIECESPQEYLRSILQKYKSPAIDYLPPFTGGLVGYFSYDYIKYTEENLKLEADNPEGFDDFYLMLFDKVIAFDHLKQKIYIILNIPVENFTQNYIEGVTKLKDMERMILKNKDHKDLKAGLKTEFKELHSKEKFMEMVDAVKKEIQNGEIFQAVISNREEAEFEGSLMQAYRILRTTNPSPYMFYLNFGDMEIIGSSPETLIKLKNNELTSFALAGTCPTSTDFDENEKRIAELLTDEKEVSEHNMLVDLARNDLGKISEFKTVHVKEYMKVLKLSNVCHLASVICSKLNSKYDQIDVIDAVLPAGTLSGAPKKRASEIIDKLEGQKRGTYGGAIGYIDFNGNVDLCIAIRMAKLQNGKVYVQAGAGIVNDSNPEKEYNETKYKAKTIIEAIKQSKVASI